MASLATFVLHGGRIGQGELTFYAVVIGASLVVAYGAWAVRQLRLWYWRRTRGPVDLREVTSVTVDVAAPSIETDLLIERVKPLCYGVWMAAKKVMSHPSDPKSPINSPSVWRNIPDR